MRSLLRRLSGRAEARQAGLIVFAQALSQVVLLGSMPVLSRLYSPEAFGEYGALVSLSTLAGSVLALCYTVAIYFPKSDRVVIGAYQICGLLTLGLGIALGGILLALQATNLVSIFTSHPYLNLALLTLSAIIVSHQTNANAYQSRIDDFRSVAFAKFNQTLFPTIFQIAAAFSPMAAAGMNIGRVVGQAATVAWTEYDLPRRFRAFRLFRPEWAAIRFAAARYADSIIHVPRVLLVRGATALPPVFLLSLYGAIPAGLFFFADRLVGRPSQLLSDSLSRIPLRNFSENIRNGKPIAGLGLGYTLVMAAVGLPPLILILAFGRPLLTFLFGTEWGDAAEFVAVTAVPAAVKLVATPMQALIVALRLQRWSTAIDAVFFFRVFLMFAAHAMGWSAFAAITIVAAVGAVYDVCNFVIAYVAALKHDQKLKAVFSPQDGQ